MPKLCNILKLPFRIRITFFNCRLRRLIGKNPSNRFYVTHCKCNPNSEKQEPSNQHYPPKRYLSRSSLCFTGKSPHLENFLFKESKPTSLMFKRFFARHVPTEAYQGLSSSLRITFGLATPITAAAFAFCLRSACHTLGLPP